MHLKCCRTTAACPRHVGALVRQSRPLLRDSPGLCYRSAAQSSFGSLLRCERKLFHHAPPQQGTGPRSEKARAHSAHPYKLIGLSRSGFERIRFSSWSAPRSAPDVSSSNRPLALPALALVDSGGCTPVYWGRSGDCAPWRQEARLAEGCSNFEKTAFLLHRSNPADTSFERVSLLRANG